MCELGQNRITSTCSPVARCWQTMVLCKYGEYRRGEWVCRMCGVLLFSIWRVCRVFGRPRREEYASRPTSNFSSSRRQPSLPPLPGAASRVFRPQRTRNISPDLHFRRARGHLRWSPFADLAKVRAPSFDADDLTKSSADCVFVAYAFLIAHAAFCVYLSLNSPDSDEAMSIWIFFRRVG